MSLQSKILKERKVRNLIGFDDLYDKWDYSRPFAFYPLHLEPELNLLLLTRFDDEREKQLSAFAGLIASKVRV